MYNQQLLVINYITTYPPYISAWKIVTWVPRLALFVQVRVSISFNSALNVSLGGFSPFFAFWYYHIITFPNAFPCTHMKQISNLHTFRIPIQIKWCYGDQWLSVSSSCFFVYELVADYVGAVGIKVRWVGIKQRIQDCCWCGANGFLYRFSR